MYSLSIGATRLVLVSRTLSCGLSIDQESKGSICSAMLILGVRPPALIDDKGIRDCRRGGMFCLGNCCLWLPILTLGWS